MVASTTVAGIRDVHASGTDFYHERLAEKFEKSVLVNDSTALILESNGHVDKINQHGYADVKFKLVPK